MDETLREAGAAEPGSTEPDYSQRASVTYMVGVYLAVNAVRDLYLLVEGPDCTHMKTQYVQGNHDWMSTLTSVSGFHRVANTALHPSHMSGSRELSVGDALLKIASHEAVPAVALTSMPMAFITGADYQRITREVAASTGKQVLHIPGKSLSGDWLDGYAEALNTFATQLDLSGGSPRNDDVAIVGYLYDRNEEDHAANVRELGRILDALGLNLVSVWLSGGAFGDLRAIRDAATIISLPYGRRAARKVARRTGARLIETPLPFGLEATERWVRGLAEAFDRADRAEALIERELSRIVPKLEWVIPFQFQNRRAGFIGEPHVVPGLRETLEMLGATLAYAVVTNRPTHAEGLAAQLGDTELLVYPKMKTLSQFTTRWALESEVHLLVSNNLGLLGAIGAVLEFGFPSYFRHALYDRPFLGFSGALSFIDSMAHALRMHEVELSRSSRVAAAGVTRTRVHR